MSRRKTGTATNSRLWNWIAVPALPLESLSSSAIVTEPGLDSPSTVLSGHPFSKFFRVAKIFGATGLLLVAEQFRTANKVGSGPF